LRRIIDDTPPRPRDVCRAAPPALEAVCLHALAKNPANRYASAGDLAREIQRWLADEPVQAYPEPIRLRLARWGRRNKTLVSSCVVLLVAAVVGLSVTAVLIGQEQARTEAEAKRARENFRLAQSAVDRYFVQISEQRLLNEPGMTPLRLELLQTAADYYAEFVKKHEDDPALRAELGNAFFKLARIHRDLGNLDRAMSRADQARTVFTGLVKKSPNDSSFQFSLAKSLYLRGALLLEKGTLDEAEMATEAAILILEQLASAKTTDPEVDKVRANAQSNLGITHSRQARKVAHADKTRYSELQQKAESAFTEAVLVHQALVKREHNSRHLLDYKDELAASHTNLANFLDDAGQAKRALEYRDEALRIHQDLVRQDNKTVRFRRNLAKSLNNKGITQGIKNEALTYFHKALFIREAIAAENPRVAVYQEDLAGGLLNLAMWHVKRAHSTDDKETIRTENTAAVASFQKALAKYEALDRDSPRTPSYLEGIGAALTGLGTVSYVADDFDTARSHYKKAIVMLETAFAQDRRTDSVMDNLCEASWGLAGIETAAGKWDKALPRWYYALEHDLRGRKTLAAEALAALEKARAAGYFKDAAHRKKLHAFTEIDPFGKSPEFQALLKKVDAP
jgi:tetratricopeptide (TPR) repeat protein